MPEQDHYLKSELDYRMSADPTKWTFLQLGSLDGVWYWNLENTDDEWMSSEFWRLFGIDPATKTHSPTEWQDIIFPEDLERALVNFQEHCEDASKPYDLTVRYRHADGSTVWVRCRGLAIRDENGKPIRMLGAHNDLTAVKVLEESARAGRVAAEAANAELRTFAYSVSHDLKAPANTMELLLTELSYELGDTGSADVKTFLDLGLATVGRMKSLVESVLDYTRIVGMEPEFVPQPLNKAAEDAIANLRSEIQRTGAVIRVGDLPVVASVGNQIAVLFQNLIANSIKFARPGVAPNIQIECSDHRSDTVKITVKDNGIGIEQQNLKRIFTIFQRLHHRDEIEGFGLGLALCHRIALTHAGDLSAQSVVGEGTCFTILLSRVDK